MKTKYFRYIAFLIVIATIFSCSNTRRLSQNDSLLIKNKIKFFGEQPDKETEDILKNLLRPKPNRKILGFRARLSLYNAMGEPRKDNFWKFIKENMGEEPVLYNESFTKKISDFLVRKLEENGHFNSVVEAKPIIKQKKTVVEYQITLHKGYKFGNYQFVSDSSVLALRIDSLLNYSLIKKGGQYRLSILKSERQRINNALKNIGFYHFSENYLRFEADTLDSKVNLTLTIKPQMPEKAAKQTYINKLTVNYGYSARKKYNPTQQDYYDSVLINYYQKDYLSSVYTEQIFFKGKDLYNSKQQYKTIRYLSSLDVFKFINLIATEDSLSDSLLNVNIFLSSLPKRNFEAELGFATKSSGYVGPNLSLSITNRNLFKRAINIKTNLFMGLEWQMGATESDLENVINLGASANIRFPKLFWPFKYDGKKGSVLPYTNLETKYNYLKYKPFVTSHILNLNFAYFYANQKNTRVEIRPFNMDYYANNIVDENFRKDLENYPSLKLSLEDRFVVGGNYYLIWDSKIKNIDKKSKKQYYYKIGVDLSGNTIYAFQNLLGLYKGKGSNFLGLAYAQFARIEIDLRNYQKLLKKAEWGFRLLSNLGLPYKNSSELPYYKQYFVGGANSIQAFLPRKIGPGAFYESTETPGSFVLHSGEIWLEADIEYRFNISGKIDGATFLNTGNIWLREKDEQRPLAEFEWNRFYKEFAIGTGFGLRLNYDILVIRLDWGIPLRYPYTNEGGNWIFQFDNFKYPDLVNKSTLNFAIGYPF